MATLRPLLPALGQFRPLLRGQRLSGIHRCLQQSARGGIGKLYLLRSQLLETSSIDRRSGEKLQRFSMRRLMAVSQRLQFADSVLHDLCNAGALLRCCVHVGQQPTGHRIDPPCGRFRIRRVVRPSEHSGSLAVRMGVPRPSRGTKCQEPGETQSEHAETASADGSGFLVRRRCLAAIVALSHRQSFRCFSHTTGMADAATVRSVHCWCLSAL